MKNEGDSEGKKDAGIPVGADQGAPTRRNFLFSLLGGAAGASGLFAIIARAKTAASAVLGSEPASPRPVAKPIDNIFTPILPRQDVKRRES